jgi:trehalose-phosphatase
LEYLFAQWEKIKKELGRGCVFLFFDYDGTLAPIAETPEKAVLPEETAELLKQLSGKRDRAVAIISGRALEDIKNIVGIKDIIYAGNHGLEIEGPKIKYECQVTSELKAILRQLCSDLAVKLSVIKGVCVEDKGLSISVHYRVAGEEDISLMRKIFNEVTDPYVAGDKIKITPGKKVYEIRPPVVWDKGKIVSWLLVRQQFCVGEDKVYPVYIGDDVTDEDAFRALKNKGLTVFVGKPGGSKARYYLNDTGDVVRFMRRILSLKEV